MKSNQSSRILLAGIAALAMLSFSAYAGPRYQDGGCGCMGEKSCVEARRQAAPNCPNADAAGCQLRRGMMNGPGHRHGGCGPGPNGAGGCPFALGEPGGSATPPLPSAPPKAN